MPLSRFFHSRRPPPPRKQVQQLQTVQKKKQTNNKQLQWLYQVPGDELLVNQRRVEEEIAFDD